MTGFSASVCAGVAAGVNSYNYNNNPYNNPTYQSEIDHGVCDYLTAFWAATVVSVIFSITIVSVLSGFHCGCCNPVAKHNTRHSLWNWLKWVSLAGAILLLFPLIFWIWLGGTLPSSVAWGGILNILFYASIFLLRLTIAIKLITRPESAHTDAPTGVVQQAYAVGGVAAPQAVKITNQQYV